MSNGILIGCEQAVAHWAFKAHNKVPHHCDRAIGIVNSGGQLVGAALIHSYNGCNATLSYYGKQTVTLGIVRSLAKISILDLDLGRVTVVVPKKSKRLARALLKFGFKVEGVQRCYFCHRDCPRNTGVRFVMFRERILQLAELDIEKAA